MLCSHVVLRHSLRTTSRRLISTAIAAPPRPRGRPKKCTSDEVRPPPRPRGRPRKNAIESAPEPATSRKCTARSLPEQDDGSPIKAQVRLPVRSRTDLAEKSAVHDSVSSLKLRKEKVVAVKGQDVASGDTTKVRRTRKRLGTSPIQGAMQHDHDHLSAPRISLLAPTTNHHDLASFLEHSRNIDSKTGTTVYRGTHYEYTVIEFLRTYNFTLRRTGRSNDLGIDLLGQWQLPSDPQELRVLVQCKASKPRPAMVRELEGAYVGAPAGWRGADVMALLITRDPATLGVRKALQRSRLPMGFAQITESGAMRQFMWNHAAQEARLTGMSVTNEYRRGSTPSSSGSTDSDVESAVSLQWMGKRWNDSESR